MNIPLINGRAYDFTQIIVNVMGVPIPSVTKIDYKEEQEKTNNFGGGNRPVSRGHGTIQPTASIEMSMTDIEKIRDIAPNGSLLSVPAFDIVVVFGNPQSPKKHTLKNVEFTVDGFEGSMDDTDFTMSFDLVLSHILYR